jgi:recombination protein RecT
MQTMTLPDGSNLPVPVARNGGVTALYAENRIQRLPIPAKLDARQFAICAITEANKLPQDTDPKSIVIAVFNAACMGTLLGPHPGHAFLVAYRNSKTQTRDCQLIMGYKGLLDLAYGANFLESVYTDVVLRGEEFRTYVKDSPHIEHELPIERELTWDRVIAAYCIWTPKAGTPIHEVVGRKDMEAIYRKAAKRSSSPWQTNPIAMCRKTAIRRAAKNWKMTRELGWAIGLDEAAERGARQQLVDPALEQADDEATTPLADLKWTDPPEQQPPNPRGKEPDG